MSLDDLPEVLTVDEAAAYLRIGRTAAYEAVRRGELPGVLKLGRTIRISRFALERVLELGPDKAKGPDPSKSGPLHGGAPHGSHQDTGSS